MQQSGVENKLILPTTKYKPPIVSIFSMVKRRTAFKHKVERIYYQTKHSIQDFKLKNFLIEHSALKIYIYIYMETQIERERQRREQTKWVKNLIG